MPIFRQFMRLVLGPLTSLLAVVLTASLALSATMGVSSGRQAVGGLDSAAVDRFVSDYLDRHGLPGAAVAVVKDGRIVHQAGYGEDSRGQPLTEHTRLRIASMSKSITAFAVLQLVDDEAVELDQPVTSYLPELSLDDHRFEEITVRQLLSHTSGIVTPTVIGPADTLREGVARVHDWTLASDPGTTYAYSNANYWIAARMVEVVTGTGFPAYLRNEVFAPLGMSNSLGTTVSNDPVPGLGRGHVMAYGLALPAPEPEQMTAGAGGMVSTAHDMARWLSMQQRSGRAANGTRLLAADLVEESHRPQPGARRGGLGWHISGQGVDPGRIGHSGAAATFQSQQDLVPSSGYGVVVLLNSFTIWYEHAYAISSGIIEITEGGDPKIGVPVPTLIDIGLLLVTLVVAVLGIRGLRRAPQWAARRAAWPHWRRGLRLVPHLFAPGLAIFLLVIGPRLQDNSLTTADVFRLAPAAMVLLVTAAVAGTSLIVARLLARPRHSSGADVT